MHKLLHRAQRPSSLRAMVPVMKWTLSVCSKRTVNLCERKSSYIGI